MHYQPLFRQSYHIVMPSGLIPVSHLCAHHLNVLQRDPRTGGLGIGDQPVGDNQGQKQAVNELPDVL